MTPIDLADDLRSIRNFLGSDQTLDQAVWCIEACHLGPPETVVGLAAVRKALAAFAAHSGWLTLQGAVVWWDGGDWKPLRPERPGHPDTMPILAGELCSADRRRSLDIRHLSGDRWQLTWATADGEDGRRDPPGNGSRPWLYRRHEHLSILEGYKLVYNIYWDVQDRGGLRCHAPVAQRFCGLEKGKGS